MSEHEDLLDRFDDLEQCIEAQPAILLELRAHLEAIQARLEAIVKWLQSVKLAGADSLHA